MSPGVDEQRFYSTVEIKTGHDEDGVADPPKMELRLIERDQSANGMFGLLGQLLTAVIPRLKETAAKAGAVVDVKLP